MPYSSLAQARKFHADRRLRKYTREYDAATDFSKLPERVKPKHKHKRRHHAGVISELARRTR